VNPIGSPFSIVCLSSQEWAGDLPTNRQQIMSRAAARGHAVLFVETGSFFGAQLWRVVRGPGRRSLVRRLFATERVGPGIRVRKAVNVIPWRTKYRPASVINSVVTAAVLERFARDLPQPVVLWIYDPASAWLIGSCGESIAVYDCVDDYVEQAVGRRRRALVARADQLAARRSALVFATTPTLVERKRALNAETHLVPNGSDADRFRPAADRRLAAAEVAALSRPVLGFAGNLTSVKVDFSLLEALARARPDWTLLLVGPSRRDSAHELGRLLERSNVRWVGPKKHEELPAYLAAFDVGLIPYRATPYTSNCFPLKVYEYLAAGKPIVASGLPELRGMEPDVVVAGGLEQFIDAVSSAVDRSTADDVARRAAIAEANTWEGRANRLLTLVSSALDGPAPTRATSGPAAP
jgi:glycosyltransferase involved in cell wall biosynthesis